jgi:hypothetical protein
MTGPAPSVTELISRVAKLSPDRREQIIAQLTDEQARELLRAHQADNQRRRHDAACRVFAGQKNFLVFNDEHDETQNWANRGTLKAMQEAEKAFAEDDFDRAEHLADVVQHMMRRDIPKFRANPKAWIAKMRELL